MIPAENAVSNLAPRTDRQLGTESPLGGWKASGLGVRHGIESLRQWTRTEAVTVGRPLLAPLERFVARKLAFPYDPLFLTVIRRASRLLYRRGAREKLRRSPRPEAWRIAELDREAEKAPNQV